MEQVRGIEPPSPVWETDILTIIRHLHSKALFLMRLKRCLIRFNCYRQIILYLIIYCILN